MVRAVLLFFLCTSSNAFIPQSSTHLKAFGKEELTRKSVLSLNSLAAPPSPPALVPDLPEIELQEIEHELPAADSPEAIRSERFALDISKTIYVSSFKAPKDAYKAFAEKGAQNAKMSKTKIFIKSVLGGMYVGFAGLLSLTIAGNMGGVAATNPGLVKMTFAALFPVNLLIILTTGGQLFTGNTATVGAAKFEKLVEWRELYKSWTMSLIGNIVGCSAFAFAAWYGDLLVGGTASLASNTAVSKCSATLGQTMVKAIMCNWMVSLAVFLAGASNDLAGKLVAIWFPISAFVGIGLEHSVANMFIMPAALLSGTAVSLKTVILKNIIPVCIGNAIAGMGIVAGSYSYQFGVLGKKKREQFREKQAAYEALVASRRA